MTAKTPDTRIPNVNSLPPGPFQLTPGVAYDAYAASPVHRFYQMCQQLDCRANYIRQGTAAAAKPTCFPGWKNRRARDRTARPQRFRLPITTTGEGSTSMGFYNVLQGDAPYLKQLADNYAMSDNYHQAVQGGTGANHVMIGRGGRDLVQRWQGASGSATARSTGGRGNRECGHRG